MEKRECFVTCPVLLPVRKESANKRACTVVLDVLKASRAINAVSMQFLSMNQFLTYFFFCIYLSDGI